MGGQVVHDLGNVLILDLTEPDIVRKNHDVGPFVTLIHTPRRYDLDSVLHLPPLYFFLELAAEFLAAAALLAAPVGADENTQDLRYGFLFHDGLQVRIHPLF